MSFSFPSQLQILSNVNAQNFTLDLIDAVDLAAGANKSNVTLVINKIRQRLLILNDTYYSNKYSWARIVQLLVKYQIPVTNLTISDIFFNQMNWKSVNFNYITTINLNSTSSLRPTSKELTFVLGSCPNLIHLVCKRVEKFNSEVMGIISDNVLSHLVTLQFSECHAIYFTRHSYERIIRLSGMIQSIILELTQTGGNYFDDLIPLTTLHIKHSKQHVSNLRHVLVRIAQPAPERYYRYVRDAHLNTRESKLCNFGGMELIQESYFLNIQNHTNLRLQNIRINDKIMATITQNSGAVLMRLQIIECRRMLSYESFVAILQHCIVLTHLHLRDCLGGGPLTNVVTGHTLSDCFAQYRNNAVTHFRYGRDPQMNHHYATNLVSAFPNLLFYLFEDCPLISRRITHATADEDRTMHWV